MGGKSLEASQGEVGEEGVLSSAFTFSNEITAQHKRKLNTSICQPLPSEAWLHSWHLCCCYGNKATIWASQ